MLKAQVRIEKVYMIYLYYNEESKNCVGLTNF